MSTETAEEPKNTEPTVSPGDDEMYCSECGEIVLRKAAVCPNCGIETHSETERSEQKEATIGKTGYLAVGSISGLIAFLFVPVVFGLLSVFCGVQLFRKHDEMLGVVIMAWGGIGMLIGVVLGMWMWA